MQLKYTHTSMRRMFEEWSLSRTISSLFSPRLSKTWTDGLSRWQLHRTSKVGVASQWSHENSAMLAHHATAGVAAPPAYNHTQREGTKGRRNMLIISATSMARKENFYIANLNQIDHTHLIIKPLLQVDFVWGHHDWSLSGGWPLFGGSTMGGSTVLCTSGWLSVSNAQSLNIQKL